MISLNKYHSINGEYVSNSLIQELTESELSNNLSKNLLRDGYVLMRNIYKKNDIQKNEYRNIKNQQDHTAV